MADQFGKHWFSLRWKGGWGCAVVQSPAWSLPAIIWSTIVLPPLSSIAGKFAMRFVWCHRSWRCYVFLRPPCHMHHEHSIYSVFFWEKLRRSFANTIVRALRECKPEWKFSITLPSAGSSPSSGLSVTKHEGTEVLSGQTLEEPGKNQVITAQTHQEIKQQPKDDRSGSTCLWCRVELYMLPPFLGRRVFTHDDLNGSSELCHSRILQILVLFTIFIYLLRGKWRKKRSRWEDRLTNPVWGIPTRWPW